MGLLQEFKEFALRGNVVDMAVGVVVGGAFGKIVSSLVADVVMPVVGVFTGGVDFNELKYVIQPGVAEAEGVAAVPEVAIRYGAFINTAIDFAIIAMAIFVAIKAMNAAQKHFEEEKEKEPEAPKEPTEDVVLLREIRDSLAKQ